MPPKPQKRKPKDSADTKPKAVTVTVKKPRSKPIEWDKNKEWTQHAINYLTENPTFRKKLFSDSTSEAKKEDRSKVQAHEGKIILYGTLAEAIFTSDEMDEEMAREYKADPHKYAKSTQQQFARLKKAYQQYRRKFEKTGGGVKEGDDIVGVKRRERFKRSKRRER